MNLNRMLSLALTLVITSFVATTGFAATQGLASSGTAAPAQADTAAPAATGATAPAAMGTTAATVLAGTAADPLADDEEEGDDDEDKRDDEDKNGGQNAKDEGKPAPKPGKALKQAMKVAAVRRLARAIERLRDLLGRLPDGAQDTVADVVGRLEQRAKDGGASTDEEVAIAAEQAVGEKVAADAATPREPRAVAALSERAGRLTSAIKALEKALEKSAEDRELYARLGALYRRKGDAGLKVYVRGKRPRFDVPPVIRDGRTLVPVRAIAEALDATVDYDAATRAVTIARGDRVVVLSLADGSASVDGRPIRLDVPAAVVSGRTVVPLRFISEALGSRVDFDAEARQVVITDPTAPAGAR